MASAEPLLRAVELDLGRAPHSSFPFTLPAIRALAALERLDFHPEVTFLVGENGSGKSTLIEAIAVALDLDAEGGDRDMRFVERAADTPLHGALRLVRGARYPSMRYFLRAESFFNVARTVDANSGLLARHGGEPLHGMSHGESFLQLVNERFYPDGLFLLDEPEAALSPTGNLALLRRMRGLALEGAQFIVATHSPVLMAYPGATIHQLGDAGIEQVSYDESDHVLLMRSFMEEPERFLRHLFAD